jgi:hypothetical protein
MPLPQHYEFRAELIQALKRDLMGPPPDDPEAEVLHHEDPLNRYITGILYPKSQAAVEPVDHEEWAEESADGVSDEAVSLANARYPSSLGMTFEVDCNSTSHVLITAHGAKYRHNETATSWTRAQRSSEPIRIPVNTNESGTYYPVFAGELDLFCRVRLSHDSTPVATVTVVLINVEHHLRGTSRDASSWFQVQLCAETEGDTPCFIRRRAADVSALDHDNRVSQLLYRHAVDFAVGHGCATEWSVSDDPERATLVRTEVVPEYEMRLSSANDRLKAEFSTALEFDWLAEADREAVLTALEQFAGAYDAWIGDRRHELAVIPEQLRAVGAENLEQCTIALDRMTNGINLLRSDDLVWDAFQMANRAMRDQRSRGAWLKSDRRSSEPDIVDGDSWRPFQLAFILLCLRGVAEPRSADREVADLLWFPTGGGKTEAYLGLMAFTIALRRLRGGKLAGGVTALMRYTLRLLTLQQFARASLLITTLEHIRQTDPSARLGIEPIEIGLWVGQDSVPNTLEKARDALNAFARGTNYTGSSPVQVLSCTWCGTALDHGNYVIDDENIRLVIRCGSPECHFRDGLPIRLTDQEVYAHRPALLLGTVDKFARLPWDEQTYALFNRETDDKPPELIIQDELHLISGPLGTLVGLYETAIDYLCEHEGAGPKVVASTATIRRASDQVRQVFARETRQFPPQGLDSRDSFFAVEATPEEVGTRTYVGLIAPGTSQTTLLVRTYARLLQQANEIAVAPESVRDAYWTLIGYFNSRRVLGGALLQVQSDVAERLKQIAPENRARRSPEPIELSARIKSEDLPNVLNRLGVEIPDANALDVVLATNMFSVGVDIDRLALMAVMGQPQTTAEYIQATSRVGRQHPGLVVTLFNNARARDRSHYETFVGYHSTLYARVEASSVTPFSARSRDRGLHAVATALARALDPTLRGNDQASAFRDAIDTETQIWEIIKRRVERVDKRRAAGTEVDLKAFFTRWRAQSADDLSFQRSGTEHGAALLGDAASPTELRLEDGIPTLWSLRAVDVESLLEAKTRHGGGR